MPSVIKKKKTAFMAEKREVFHAISWQVRSHIWSPPTDVYETGAAIVVLVEVAGMQNGEFEVTLEENLLKIAGSRIDPSERRTYHQMEIRFGKFETSVVLPGLVSVENSHAEYHDGFLTVILPKETPFQEG